MPKQTIIKNKEGFTIIEVVLVLAIAGLIFLMVFLAFPALQRAQKDTQRRDQLSMLITQITNYQANNRNKLPSCDSSGGSSSKSCIVVPDSETGKIDNAKTGWEKFYASYLLAQNDVFEDPNGNPYKLQVVDCGTTSGEECSVQRYNWGFDSAPGGTSGGGDDTGLKLDNGSKLVAAIDGVLLADTGEGGGSSSGPTDKNQDYYILITTGASCEGEVVVPNTGARRVAVAYKLEGGGTFCQGN